MKSFKTIQNEVCRRSSARKLSYLLEKLQQNRETSMCQKKRAVNYIEQRLNGFQNEDDSFASVHAETPTIKKNCSTELVKIAPIERMKQNSSEENSLLRQNILLDVDLSETIKNDLLGLIFLPVENIESIRYKFSCN